jgi:transposase
VSVEQSPSQLIANPQERAALEQWCRRDDRRLATRATLILALADGASNEVVAARFGVSSQTVGKWRTRFQHRRLEGLLDDPRSGAPRRIGDDDVKRVLSLTQSPPPPGVPRWTTRLLARTCGLSQTAVSRIWRRHGLSPRSSDGADSTDTPASRAEAPRSENTPSPAEPAGPTSIPDPDAEETKPPEVKEMVAWLRRIAANLEGNNNDSLRSAVEVLQAAQAALSAYPELNAQASQAMAEQARRRARQALKRARSAVEQSQSAHRRMLTREALKPPPEDELPLACQACGRQLRLVYTAEGPPLPAAKVALPCPGCHEPVELSCPEDATDVRLE